MSGRRKLAIFAVAALFGALVWHFAGIEEREALPSRSEDPGPTTPHEEAPPDPWPTPETNAPDTPPPPPAAGGGHRLVGRIAGLDASLPGRAGVEVRALSFAGGRPPTPVSGAASRDGRLDLDISSLFAGGFAPSELEVRVDHPEYLPARERVRVEPGPEHSVEVRLLRAAIVRGRVLDEPGDAVAGATVSLHRMKEGDPVRDPADRTTTEADGAYRLRGEPGGERHLVVAWREDLAPDAKILSVVAGPENVASDLILRPGCEITGRVLARGAGVEGAEVSLGPRPRGGALQVGRTLLSWTGSGIAKGSLRVKTGPDGAYRLAGLSRAEHGVTVKDVPGLHMHSGFSARLLREVVPPASGVDFDVTGARVVLDVRAGEEPLEGLSLSIRGGGGLMILTLGAEERPTLLLAPEERHDLTFFKEGYLSTERELPSIPEGVETDLLVNLAPRPPRATLIVTFRVEEGAPAVTRAGFGLYPPGSSGAVFPACLKDEVVADPTGCFRVEDLSPGRHVLVARPGTSWFETRGHFLYAEAEVDLPEGGEAAIALDARLGGRIRVAARDKEEKFLGAPCRILNAENLVVPARFVCQDASSMSWSQDGLVGEAPNDVNPPLTPGRYRVEFDLDGYHPESVEAVVEKGRTTEVEVVLHPR